MTAHATAEQLAAWLGTTAPTDAARLLRRASRLVDTLLVAAVYDVDEQGQPTSPAVLAVLADATCAQVEAWIDSGQAASGDTDDSTHELAELRAAGATSVSFGPISIGLGARTSSSARAASTGGEDWTTPARATLDALHVGGLWPASVRTW